MSATKASPRCRSCGSVIEHTFADLGSSPLCQAHLTPERLNAPEPHYPLHARVCHACLLVQVDDSVAPAEIFGDGSYAYFSSFSDSWVEHARRYAEQMIPRLALDERSRVVEIASNDGYLLQHFAAKGIPVLGIEPAANCAAAARERGVETRVEFFGEAVAARIAEDRGRADLLIGNNVLAHVPRIEDFVAGLAVLLAPSGVITLEFPHLLRLIEHNQFDTIYHEHFSYLSMFVVERIFARHGLVVFDVDELSTHGGSLRVFARHADAENPPVHERVDALREHERAAGLFELATYAGFQERVRETKRALLSFLIEHKRAGRSIVGYGAPGKGNTLLNYCGIGTDFVDYTVDRSPHKQGNYLPGSRIPIHAPARVFETRPDFLLILPWNLRAEITEQMSGIREWGGRFVVPIPEVKVYA